jgi:hypothetical protein
MAAQGGGVYIYGQVNEFTMKSGTIQGNTATAFGGGVAGKGLSQIKMEGGNIWNNTVPLGGGIYVDTSSSSSYGYPVFTLKGGSIMGNTASLGGGIYINQTEAAVLFTMEGDARVHRGNPVYITGNSNGPYLNISGTLNGSRTDPVADIITTLSSGGQLLQGDYGTDNNYVKFWVDGQPDKIGSDGKLQ